MKQAVSHPAILRLLLRDRLSATALRRLKAKCLTTAMFLAPWPLRRRDGSSLKTTSNTQCKLFSMAQWPRMASAACLADRAAELMECRISKRPRSLNSVRAKNLADHRQSVRHEIITHVSGTNCYPCLPAVQKQDGGEDGIRTHEKLLTSTPLAGERLRPLGHLSVAPLDKEKRRHNQQARVIISKNKKVPSCGFPRCGGFAAIPRLETRAPAIIPSADRGIRLPTRGAAGPMVNQSFPSEAKSCHLCNNARG